MTTRSLGLMIGSTLSSTSPMLPPTHVRCPACLKISPTSVVVVVLPALPVMPITGAGQRSMNNWASLVSGTP